MAALWFLDGGRLVFLLFVLFFRFFLSTRS